MKTTETEAGAREYATLSLSYNHARHYLQHL